MTKKLKLPTTQYYIIFYLEFGCSFFIG